MELSIRRINTNKNTAFTPISKSTKHENQVSSNSEINLNNDPRCVFMGYKYEPKYGPYNLTRTELLENDEEAESFVEMLAGCLKNEDWNRDYCYYEKERMDDDDVKEAIPLCISLICGYSSNRTSFPRFCDSTLRAFPKACAEYDGGIGSDNMARLYEGIINTVDNIGKRTDPESDDTVKSGLSYLYFTDKLPAIEIGEYHNSTYETLELMESGVRPTLSHDKKLKPRCHMSKVEDEIDVHGTEYVKKHFGKPSRRGAVGHYSNDSGSMRNRNQVIKEVQRERTQSLIEAIIEAGYGVDPWEQNS